MVICNQPRGLTLKFTKSLEANRALQQKLLVTDINDTLILYIYEFNNRDKAFVEY